MKPLARVYEAALSRLVLGLAGIAGAGLICMMLVTVADVVGRCFRHPIRGTYDIVCIAGVVTLACGLPYTTAVKGHIAVEYFFHALSRPWRRVVDTITRMLGTILFAILTWQCAAYGHALYVAGEKTLTLNMPVFWVPYLIAVNCGTVTLVILHNMLHFGREMIKP